MTKISGLETDFFGKKMMVKSGLEFFILIFTKPRTFRVAAAQCKKICPQRLNWSGRLADISEGHRGISKHFFLDHFSSSFSAKNGVKSFLCIAWQFFAVFRVSSKPHHLPIEKAKLIRDWISILNCDLWLLGSLSLPIFFKILHLKLRKSHYLLQASCKLFYAIRKDGRRWKVDKCTKAELQQEGILFCTQFSSLGIFISKKVENWKNLKVVHKALE